MPGEKEGEEGRRQRRGEGGGTGWDNNVGWWERDCALMWVLAVEPFLFHLELSLKCKMCFFIHCKMWDQHGSKQSLYCTPFPLCSSIAPQSSCQKPGAFFVWLAGKCAVKSLMHKLKYKCKLWECNICVSDSQSLHLRKSTSIDSYWQSTVSWR